MGGTPKGRWSGHVKKQSSKHVRMDGSNSWPIWRLSQGSSYGQRTEHVKTWPLSWRLSWALPWTPSWDISWGLLSMNIDEQGEDWLENCRGGCTKSSASAQSTVLWVCLRSLASACVSLAFPALTCVLARACSTLYLTLSSFCGWDLATLNWSNEQPSPIFVSGVLLSVLYLAVLFVSYSISLLIPHTWGPAKTYVPRGTQLTYASKY